MKRELTDRELQLVIGAGGCAALALMALAARCDASEFVASLVSMMSILLVGIAYQTGAK